MGGAKRNPRFTEQRLAPRSGATKALLLVAVLLCIGTLTALCEERSYWVWQRSEALTAGEIEELKHQGVATLYWHVVTVKEDVSLAPFAKNFAKLAPGFLVVPVVRVETATLPIAADFQKLARYAHEGTLQIDFDSPDRLLGVYAERLAELRANVPHLGITALAHWPSVKDFTALARSVEEICPMFYDLQADPSDVSAKAPAPPLLDPAQVEKLLAGWKTCPTRWRAGLPVFSRITVFEDGVSRGQIPSWEWDEVTFNKHLHTIAPTKLGVTLLRAEAPALVSRRPLRAGEILAVRTTDPVALQKCRTMAGAAGSAGTVLFRLPAAGAHATWSLRSLRDDTAAKPQLVLQKEGDVLVLKNTGGTDLPPRLAGPGGERDRGYELEIDAPAPVFREAETGGFFRVKAHVSPEHEPRAVGVTLATRLTFWFSQLHAGASVRSGIFQLAPAADITRLRWRVSGGDWQPLISP